MRRNRSFEVPNATYKLSFEDELERGGGHPAPNVAEAKGSLEKPSVLLCKQALSGVAVSAGRQALSKRAEAGAAPSAADPPEPS